MELGIVRSLAMQIIPQLKRGPFPVRYDKVRFPRRKNPDPERLPILPPHCIFQKEKKKRRLKGRKEGRKGGAAREKKR
jgi:hypothetical protein